MKYLSENLRNIIKYTKERLSAFFSKSVGKHFFKEK